MIIRFDLEGKQATKYYNWRMKHRKCSSKVGAAGGANSITFTPTGLGTIVEAKCICGKKLNLTDPEEFS